MPVRVLGNTTEALVGATYCSERDPEVLEARPINYGMWSQKKVCQLEMIIRVPNSHQEWVRTKNVTTEKEVCLFKGKFTDSELETWARTTGKKFIEAEIAQVILAPDAAEADIPSSPLHNIPSAVFHAIPDGLMVAGFTEKDFKSWELIINLGVGTQHEKGLACHLVNQWLNTTTGFQEDAD